MDVEERFVSLSGLICEPTRARMLWNLLDGRAYTASELSVVAQVSATAASNHLSKLLEADIVKVDTQGRHRYYSLSRPEVAYVVESLANLASDHVVRTVRKESVLRGVRFCRSCYDHLAGFVGVRIIEALEQKGCMQKTDGAYAVTEKGWKWFAAIDISRDDFPDGRRPLTRQCLDWSERRPHLAGQLGALLLQKALQRNWFKKVSFSRELVVTSKGQQELYDLLDLSLGET